MRPKLRYTPQSLQSAASMLHSIIGPLSKAISNRLMQAAIGQMISDHRYRNGKNRGIEASGIRQRHSFLGGTIRMNPAKSEHPDGHSKPERREKSIDSHFVNTCQLSQL